jgi:bifunctional DNase/RNase
MHAELIPITFHKILQSHAYTVVVLGTLEKKFEIYMEPQIGKDIQIYLAQGKKKRPSSQELIQSILQGYQIQPLQIVINDVQDTIYFARLFLETMHEGQRIITEIDARPSDCITLAILSNIPMYCRKEVLEKAIPYS